MTQCSKCYANCVMDDDCRSETAHQTNKPTHRSSSARTIAGQETSAMHRSAPRLLYCDYFFCSSFHGSLTAVPTVSISTLASLPPTLRTSRRYSFCTMSRVAGSIEIGPRGLFECLK